MSAAMGGGGRVKPRIDAVGMVSALGLDARTSCAAIRAGLDRAAPVPGSGVIDPDSQVEVPLVGHAVWGVPSGAAPVARWLSLAARAFEDLCRDGQLPDGRSLAFWQATALLVVLPVLDDERFFFDAACDPEAMRARYVRPLLDMLGLPDEVIQVQLIDQGRAGAMQALRQGEEMLARGAVQQVVLLAADSYLDAHSLGWLAQGGRLKAADRPCGLMPGEAAAAVLLTGGDAPDRRENRVCLRLASAVLDAEAGGFLDGERRNGRALARAIGASILESGVGTPFGGDVVVDLNGEDWRAQEWGSALAQVPRGLLELRCTVMPVMSIGDVGAATALTSLVVACRAHERGYAGGRSTMVVCAGEEGRVGALMVDAGVR